jgi:protein-disulfide isomerase
MSKREERRQLRQQKTRQKQAMLISAIVLVAVSVVGILIYQTSRPIGEWVTVTKESFPYADGKVVGPTDAPVVIRVFSDFQCPYCGRFATGAERQLIEQYAATGQVRLEYRHYIVVDGNVGGSESRRAAEASECASAQGDFWNYHAMLFANQQGEGLGAFSDRRLKAFAEALELDTAQFNTCLDSGRYADEVQTDEQLARSLGVHSTPTVLVNGSLVQNPLNFAEFEALIQAQLAQGSLH